MPPRPAVFMNRKFSHCGARSTSLGQVLRDLARRPIDRIARRWNWKAALLSSLVRGAIFFSINLVAGPHAALEALVTELAFRGIVSGFYGALTEAFRFVEPEWAAAVAAMILLPLLGHSVEFAVHFLRGTAKLKASIVGSVCFTAVSTLFNLYAMRRGALVTGEGRETLGSDLKRMPRLIAGFLAAGPRAVWRLFSRKLAAYPRSLPSVRPAPGETSD